MINENSVTDHEALGLFKAALQDLLLFFPLSGLSYLGEAVEVVEDNTIKTLATDGRRVMYSPKWIRESEHNGRIFDALHEWLHIFMNHVARCGDRDGKVWNVACDVVVVREACRILTRDGGEVWTAPKDGVIPPDWAKDMMAEEIYDQLISGAQKMPAGTGSGEHQQSKDFLFDRQQPDSDVGKEEEFRRKFTEELAQAILIQQQIHNKTTAEMFGPVIGKRLEEIMSNTVPWSRLLRGRLIDDMGQEAPTFAPPNRRYFDEITLPSMRSVKEERLVLLVDVSASVGEKLFGVFKANVIPAALRAKETIIITFDAVVREVVRTKHPRQALDQVKFLTGAHSFTSTIGAFELIDKFKPKAMACLTDGGIMLPEKAYPQMNWVIPRNGQRQPWGRHFVMEVSW